IMPEKRCSALSQLRLMAATMFGWLWPTVAHIWPDVKSRIFLPAASPELGELVDPSHTALLVIDMQNDFCSPGGASDRGGASLSMYPAVTRRIADVLR